MTDSPSNSIRSWPWLSERPFPRGTNLILWVSLVILVSLFIMYVVDPPEVSQFRLYSTLTALALLMVINILLDYLKGTVKNHVSNWIAKLNVPTGPRRF